MEGGRIERRVGWSACKRKEWGYHWCDKGDCVWLMNGMSVRSGEWEYEEWDCMIGREGMCERYVPLLIFNSSSESSCFFALFRIFIADFTSLVGNTHSF